MMLIFVPVQELVSCRVAALRSLQPNQFRQQSRGNTCAPFEQHNLCSASAFIYYVHAVVPSPVMELKISMHVEFSPWNFVPSVEKSHCFEKNPEESWETLLLDGFRFVQIPDPYLSNAYLSYQKKRS
ncbi:hypothetical protein RB195_004927 [Necator americanus]|uniref:Uncharacterized protein n=1 Tax=Necator americanus TaxID=51031 RepID=A0ABR1BKE1_NECAM